MIVERWRIITDTDTILPTDEGIIFNTAGTKSIVLHSPRGYKKAHYLVNLTANDITITMADALATINGAATFVLSAGNSGVMLLSDNLTQWFALTPTWGDIAGTITDQADLALALAVAKAQQVIGGTIATTSTSDAYLVAPYAGSLASAEIDPLVALATSDTNFITWTITNLGQAGAGSTAMLAATDPNTTKATGGVALAINTRRTFTVHGTAANLIVAAGDLLLIRATATGTLANTVTRPIYTLRFV